MTIAMLVEVRNVKQLKDEPRRRWFNDEYFDLIVWIDKSGKIIGFQLCYDKCGTERALTWHYERGFIHKRVDDGEERIGRKASPILVADGECNIDMLASRFAESCSKIDSVIHEFIIDKLRKYSTDSNH